MSDINHALAEILATVERPGDFYAAGKREFLAPRLEVEGVGPVALPLLPVQAEQLVAVAEQAPYGKGEDTLVDTAVRRTWQIGAERVRIGGKHWPSTLDAIVAHVTEGLGVAVPVDAELYKLLVYDVGSFFIRHRDTEKVSGMFATLVIVLPSVYTGGELLVRHRGEEARLDLAVSEPSELAYAAFYADCVHEVLPVTSGCRLALIYTLRRRDGGVPPEPPSYAGEQARVADLLRHWADAKAQPDDDTPEKLIYPLEHAYSSAELAFAALKGVDAAVAEVVRVAAEQAACELHLALVSIKESGGAQYYGDDYGYRRGRRRYEQDGEDFEIGEVYDRYLRLTDWRKPDGQRPDMIAFPFAESELCPPDAFAGLEPDELHFHEATGNEGASFERTYRRAGLILWPRARTLAVFNQVGLSLTLPYLGRLCEAWEAAGQAAGASLWQQAHELSGHMLRTWPRENWRYPRYESTQTAQMLDHLVRLRDVARVDAFIAEFSAQGVYGSADNSALTQAVALLPPQRAAELLERLIAHNAEPNFSACADLLDRVAKTFRHTIDLLPAATALFNATPGISLNEVRRPSLRVEPGCLTSLLAALVRIDPAQGQRAAEHILACPHIYNLDSTLLPAVLKLAELPEIYASSAVQSLRAACLDHLRARIADPLEPPSDWTRDSAITCRCVHCGQLRQFLADPGQREWLFKAVQAERDHVADSIRYANADLDLRTETQGRPYTLICTKNQASFDRRVRQRGKDLEDWARLEASMEDR